MTGNVEMTLRALKTFRYGKIESCNVNIADAQETSVTVRFESGDTAIFYPAEIVDGDDHDDPVDVICDYCAYRDICKYEDEMRSAVSVIGTKLKDIDAPHTCKVTCECFRKLIV